MRTHDMILVAEKFAQAHGHKLFSMEVWGGATFDVALRFLHECPWRRLELLREAIPNTLLQMLLRGTNAVGYTAYPDNLIEKFIEQAAKTGIDIFRIFDSLNYVPSMFTSINAVRERTGSIAEACICYTSDIFDETRPKYMLPYYLDLAKRLEDAGAHILAIKDMAGLLKPMAAKTLVAELKKHVDIPIHLHTHDTSGIQAATYLNAIEAGVDVVDVALASMSGLTSQPNFNSLVGALEGHRRENKLDLDSLDAFSNYWEAVREIYYPFEGELKAGTAEVYKHEIPGGQYTNLRPQARSLGLEHKFEQIKDNYRQANLLLGDIVKVTPSSKVVGDLAMFMTSNDLSPADVLERGDSLAFPNSVKSLLRGELGKVEGGFPPRMVEVVLKGEQPMTGAANSHLSPVEFDKEMAAFTEKFGADLSLNDFLSYKLYPKVFAEYHAHFEEFGDVSKLPTSVFFYGMKPIEEVLIEIAPGKTLLITFQNVTEADIEGNRLVFFKYNGTARSLKVKDRSVKSEVVLNKKAEGEREVGAPLQGSLGSILVKVGDVVRAGDSILVLEAMKMENIIKAPGDGTIKLLKIKKGDTVEKNQVLIEL